MIECERCGKFFNSEDIVRYKGNDYCNGCYNTVFKGDNMIIKSIRPL